MTEYPRVSVRLQVVRDPTGDSKVKATIPARALFEVTLDQAQLELERNELEDKYSRLVNEVRSLLKAIRERRRRPTAILYWEIGNKIRQFEAGYEHGHLVVERLLLSLARDCGVSDKVLARCVRFRKIYDNRDSVRADRSFESYVREFEGGYIAKSRQETKGQSNRR